MKIKGRCPHSGLSSVLQRQARSPLLQAAFADKSCSQGMEEDVMSRNIVLVDPLPRTLDLIMKPDVRRRLENLGELVICEDRQMPAEQVDALLPETVLIFGQTDMPRE